MRNILALVTLLLSVAPAQAQVSQDIHDRCLRAADYSGCVLQQKAAKPQDPAEERRNELYRTILRMAEERQRQQNQMLRDAMQYNPYNNVISPLDAMRMFQ